MGTIIMNKSIHPLQIQCDEKTQITLTLTASPRMRTDPMDIMLVLDRSASMSGAPLAALKTAVINFINTIKIATNSGDPNATQIGTPSRIGIVSYATNATLDAPLARDVTTLITKVNALASGGERNHREAFSTAITGYASSPIPSNKKIMIVFTVGNTTTGGNATPIASQARNQGIEIYCIGLLGSGLSPNTLNNWVSSPHDSHIFLVQTSNDLNQVFEDLASQFIELSAPGAIDIVIQDTVNDEFEIIGSPILSHPPTTTANAVIDPLTNKMITWTLNQLGVLTTESAILTFQARYLNRTSGTLPVNKSLTYTDQSDPPNQIIITPDIPPEVTIDCECSDQSLILGVRLRNICSGRRIALGLMVTEVVNGIEVEREYRAITIPAQTISGTGPCTEVVVKPITFVFPRDPDDLSDPHDERTFRVRVISHYSDTGITGSDVCPTISVIAPTQSQKK